MNLKKYVEVDMQQAKEKAKRELGSDAVMLNYQWVRPSGMKNVLGKKMVEVTFAYDPTKLPSAVKAQEILKLVDAEKTHSKKMHKSADVSKIVDASNEQFLMFDKRMNALEDMLNDFVDKFTYVKREITYDFTDEINTLLQNMIDCDVKEELAHSLAKNTEQMLRKQPETSATEVLEHLLHEQFGRPEPILHKKFTQKIVLVLGPTGVGKTTTIAKLAADFAVKQKKKVGIINTDTNRVGAHEQWELYTDIMKIPLEEVYWADELNQVMKNLADRELIFVDTAGKSPGDSKHKEELLDILGILKPEDTLLCISATTSFASVKEIVDTYGYIEDYKILITKLDETKHRGPLLNISWYTQKPFAYTATGQNVPDDIQVADIDAIVKRIVR